MALFKVKSTPTTSEEDLILCKIRQRRLQVLVHSYIYYDLGDTLVSDSKWQQWANELVTLQKKYPEESNKAPYAEEFKDFDATTGFHLPYRRKSIVNKAEQLVEYHRRRSKNE